MRKLYFATDNTPAPITIPSTPAPAPAPAPVPELEPFDEDDLPDWLK